MNLGITQNLTETGYSGLRIRKKNRKRSAKKEKRKNQKKIKKRLDWWFCRRCFWGVRPVGVRLLGFGSGSGKIVKCQTDLQKKCQMGLHNDIGKSPQSLYLWALWGFFRWRGYDLGTKINFAI